ncbi:histidine kinase [Brevibacillus panacihumi W25]|uniref:histidine kinase n=1 Tax=Brevibacillus panacihumi W25 TaxID=1408254 RepID=V6M4F3_9BACL|nr:ATP-binding protein [Brevibacillus panacihumi]EST53501.1 histidine kinase [Brevibacillus panacihumi W25]
MTLTVRQKIFICMGLLVLILGGSHAVTNLVYMESLFDQFRNEEIGAAFLNAPPEEQIEILKTYVVGKMELFWLGKWGFFIATGLFFSLWISGVLTLPLRKLVAAIERVAKGDLEVSVPVQSKDEYGKVIQTFNDMTLRLREAEDARRRLVADVTHELRTPLSIMQLKLENYQQAGHPVPPEMLRIHDEVIRLSLLVEDLHVLSLAEAGRLTLDCKPLDLTAHLERIVEQNALFARVSVIDTGIGIPEEDLLHLFDRFYRVEEARSRHSGGTGLGLSIAHHFVRAHGGFIHVSSQPDEGTIFTVYLPLSNP